MTVFPVRAANRAILPVLWRDPVSPSLSPRGRRTIRVQEDIKVTAASSRHGYARPATGIWRGEFTPPWEWRQQDRRR